MADAADQATRISTALDSVVSVNSLFGAMIFLGLSFSSTSSSLVSPSCHAGDNFIPLLILFEIVSFAFFLSSSISAYALKFHIKNNTNAQPPDDPGKSADWGVALIVAFSCLGCIFLLISMVFLTLIRFGWGPSCYRYTVSAFIMLTFVVFAVIGYSEAIRRYIYSNCFENNA